MDKLSVVILNYNSNGFLINCLKSLKVLKEEINLDIWVIDNASTDESVILAKQSFPKIKQACCYAINYISEKENIGFSKGNNLGLRKVKNEYVLILNPDTEIFPGTLKYMIQFMKDHQNVGAATCRVELPDGTLDWGSHRGFPTPFASFLYYFLKNDSLYHQSSKDMKKTHEVDAISGSFFLTRKSVLDKVGIFDENYFMYAEDLDLCFRIKKAGFRIMYIPDVKIIHYKGVASGIKSHSQEISTATYESKLKAFNSFYETMKIFYKKNLEKSYPFFINWLVYLAINLKWALDKGKLQV